MGIVDGHAHLRLGQGTRDHWLHAMDATGIDQAVVVGGGVLSPLDLAENIATGRQFHGGFDNRALLTFIDGEARLKPFYFANPWEGSVEYREVGRSFFGLKMAPAIHGLPFADSRNLDYFSAAATLRHPIYLHCLPREGYRVSDLLAVTADYPNVAVILGHGGTSQLDLYAIELIREQPQIFFETSGVFTYAIRYALSRLGAARVIFGTEYPLQDPRAEVAKAQSLDLDANTYQAYTRSNILRLVEGSV